MKKDRSLTYRVIISENHTALLHYSWIILPLGLIIIVPLSLLLTKWFPMISRPAWFLLPCVLFILYIVVSTAFLIHKIHLTEDRIVITWCGIRMKSLRPEDLIFLCAVGNEWGDHLCLSCHTPEELAQMEEACMLRNWITRYEVPFLKRQSNHMRILARNHLLRLLNKPLLILQKQKIAYLPMRTDLLHRLRGLYPHLPYKNYTQCSKYRKNTYGTINEILSVYGVIPYFHPEIKEDHILYYSGKKVKRTVPLSQVRSIVRLDLFMIQSKHAPHHLPLLFLSDRSIEQMAERSDLYQGSTALRAYNYAYDRGRNWRITTPGCCNLPCTEEMICKLQELCPNAQWLDLSDSWFADSP